MVATLAVLSKGYVLQHPDGTDELYKQRFVDKFVRNLPNSEAYEITPGGPDHDIDEAAFEKAIYDYNELRNKMVKLSDNELEDAITAYYLGNSAELPGYGKSSSISRQRPLENDYDYEQPASVKFVQGPARRDIVPKKISVGNEYRTKQMLPELIRHNRDQLKTNQKQGKQHPLQQNKAKQKTHHLEENLDQDGKINLIADKIWEAMNNKRGQLETVSVMGKPGALISEVQYDTKEAKELGGGQKENIAVNPYDHLGKPNVNPKKGM